MSSEGSGSPSHSIQSDILASITKVLDVTEKAVDGLPIYRPKAVMPSIRSMLQSVGVKDKDITYVLYECCLHVVPSNQSITPAVDNVSLIMTPISPG